MCNTEAQLLKDICMLFYNKWPKSLIENGTFYLIKKLENQLFAQLGPGGGFLGEKVLCATSYKKTA